MNYLAHTLLSKKHIDYQIANFLADHLKGRPWAGSSELHHEGLMMHKAIDRFTDDNPHVQRAKNRLGSGYLKGVVIDIAFDYFVIKYWDVYTTIAFKTFTQQFYQQAEQSLGQLPDSGTDFVKRAIKYDFLSTYQDFAGLVKVFGKVDERLSPKILAKESTTDYVPVLEQQFNHIEQDFLQFFPELIEMFLAKSQAPAEAHYFSKV